MKSNTKSGGSFSTCSISSSSQICLVRRTIMIKMMKVKINMKMKRKMKIKIKMELMTKMMILTGCLG